ncbi:hypothetical protein ACQ3I4_02725 [Zafaria sp. Z1313]|uniref:hypothetical protein n=1 Tax=unclassified Zafaria TaxID=2828765 RepID=UPI002E7960F8|nr:hypothetical protein [Zafaria sp. J156]MEE1621183.1 hypothetical protein [Zafaria sp. J156]
MYVVTIDQRASRRKPDLVDGLVERLNREYSPVRPFERTAGDELQGVFDDGRGVAALVLDVAATGEWSIGVGVGSVRLPLPRQTRAGAGEAFELARDAVERAKSSPGSLALNARDPRIERVEAELQLIAGVDARRSPASQEAGLLVAGGRSQKEAAGLLGVSQQAVSSRLASGLWQQCRRLERHAAEALHALDAPDGGE